MAFLLQGAKSSYSFFHVFLLTSIAFYFIKPFHKENARISKFLFAPFALLFLWCWIPLIGGAPLDKHLISITKAFCFFQIIWIFGTLSNVSIGKLIGIVIGGLSCLEAFVVLAAYPASFLKGGFLVGNPSYSALLLSAGMIYFLVIIGNPSLDMKKMALFFLLLLWVTFALILTGSRATILGTGLACLLFIKKRNTSLALLIMAILSMVWISFHPESIERITEIQFGQMAESFRTYYLGRILIWKTGLLALMDRWLMGYGLSNFEAAYNLHQQPEMGLLRYGKSTIFAHNDYLQLAIGTGLPGFGLLVWGITSLIKHRPKFSKLSWPLQWAFGVCVVFLVSSLFNFNFYLPFTGILFASCLGLILPHIRHGIKMQLTSFKVITIFFSIIFSVFLLLNGLADQAKSKGQLLKATRIMPIRSDLWYDLALMKLKEKKDSVSTKQIPSVVIHYLHNSLRWNPWDPFVWSRLARINFHRKLQPYPMIIRAYERALALKPNHAPFWIQFGHIDFHFKNTQMADEKFKKALELEPKTPLPYYAVGLTQLSQGYFDEAKALFREALFIHDKYNDQKGTSEYARFLFAIDRNKIDNLIGKLEKKKKDNGQ
ncbi:hypothetical protein BVX98_03185 [bacterium F11]|nr:hypothetical protein BVX98_03185 [bacterium F11]